MHANEADYGIKLYMSTIAAANLFLKKTSALIRSHQALHSVSEFSDFPTLNEEALDMTTDELDLVVMEFSLHFPMSSMIASSQLVGDYKFRVRISEKQYAESLIFSFRV